MLLTRRLIIRKDKKETGEEVVSMKWIYEGVYRKKEVGRNKS